MGGNGKTPAETLRTLIDHGPSEGTEGLLSAPWHELRAQVLRGQNREERIDYFAAAVYGLAQEAEIVWRVNQADFTSEPPLPDYEVPPPKPRPQQKAGGEPKMERPQAPQADPRARPRHITELLNGPEEPLEWLVEGLVSRHSLNLLVGAGGAKKTFAMMDLAMCVLLGVDWLGRKTRAGRVLWIDEESGAERLRRRFNQAASGHNIHDPSGLPFHYRTIDNYNLRLDAEADVLRTLVFQSQADLVVIDALADVMPGADENSVRDVQPVFQRLRAICESQGAAIIVIHHANKAGGYRGSSALKGAVELLLMTESKPETPYIKFFSNKTRDTPPVSFAAQIHFEPQGGAPQRVRLTPVEASLADKAQRQGEPLSKAGRYVLEFLGEKGESGRKEIVESTNTFSPSSIDLGIKDLRELNLIVRVNEGGRGAKAIYGLTEEGEEFVN